MTKIIATALLALFSFTLSAQAPDTTAPETPDMNEALGEMQQMLDTLDLSKMMEEGMGGMDLNKMLEGMDISKMLEGGIPGMEGMDMNSPEMQKMIEQGMQMMGQMDMNEINKLLEGIDMSEMTKMLEGMDLSKMLEGMDMQQFEGIMPPATAPTKEKDDLKKI